MPRLATKEPGEREDDEASRLVRPAPQDKPPRRDKRRERMNVDDQRDPDLDTKDTSLNYKVIGGSVTERVVLRYLVRKAAEGQPKPPRPRGPDDKIPARSKATGEKVYVTRETLKSEPDKYEKWQVKDKSKGGEPPPPAGQTPAPSGQPASTPAAPPASSGQGSPGTPSQQPQQQQSPAQKPAPKKEPDEDEDDAKDDEEKEEEEDDDDFEEEQEGDDDDEEDDDADAEPVAKKLGIKKPQRRKVSVAERAETTLFLADNLPAEVAAKFIKARIHPDDARALVDNYQAAKTLSVGNPAEFATKVSAFFQTNPDQVEPPPTWVNRKGKRVAFEALKPKDKASAYREHQMQVVAMSLAAQHQLEEKLSFGGAVPPKLAKTVTRALLGKSKKGGEEVAAKVFEAIAAEPGRGLKIPDGLVERINNAVGKNADAKRILQSFLEANDYKQAKYLYLSGSGGVSERDSPQEITDGIRKARAFFSDRGRAYGNPDSHEGAKRFETKTLAQLKKLEPKKYEQVRLAIDRDDAHEYDKLSKQWERYDKKAEEWARRTDLDEEAPKPPKGKRPIKPLGYTNASSEADLKRRGRKQRKDLYKRFNTPPTNPKGSGKGGPAPATQPAGAAAGAAPSGQTPPSAGPANPQGNAPAQAPGSQPKPSKKKAPAKKKTAARVAAKYLNSSYPSGIPMDQPSKRALYHGIEPAVHYPHGPYSRGEQVPVRSLGETDFDEILSSAQEWLQTVGSPGQALDLALQTSNHRVDIQTYEILLARLGGSGRVGKTAFEDRAKLEKAVFARFPPDSRQRKGSDLVVMLTGDTASTLKRDQYDMVRLSTLSDPELELLAKTLRLRTARASSFSSAPTNSFLRTTDNGAMQMLRLSSEQKAAANNVLGHLDSLAKDIQKNHETWGLSFKAAKKLVNHLDKIADKTESLLFGAESLLSRQAELAVASDSFKREALNDGLVTRATLSKAAKVLQRDADEPYMDTFKNPMSPHETDSDEPYMAAYGDDQSSAVVEGEDDTGRELAPEA